MWSLIFSAMFYLLFYLVFFGLGAIMILYGMLKRKWNDLATGAFVVAGGLALMFAMSVGTIK